MFREFLAKLRGPFQKHGTFIARKAASMISNLSNISSPLVGFIVSTWII